MITREFVMYQIEELPTLSDAYQRFHDVLGCQVQGPDALERILDDDPLLLSNLLRVANTTYFGVPGRVTGLPRAVDLLGPRLREAAASVALAMVAPPRLPGYDISAHDFWLHCMAVARLAENLAGELELEVPPQTFLAGLLHDIGKLVIGGFLSESAVEVLALVRDNNESFISAERQVLQGDHSEYGAVLMERWRLPAGVAEVARWHHRPDGPVPEEHLRLVDLVHTADALAHSLGYGSDVGELARRIAPGATGRLGVKVQRLERLACDSMEQIGSAAAVFDPHRRDT